MNLPMSRSRLYLMVAPLLTVLLLGCSTSSNDGFGTVIGSVSFTVIGAGSNFAGGTVDTKIIEIYTDQVSYDNAVNRYSLPVDDEVIDFASNQVVLITMGSQNSGGYMIAAESVKDVGDNIELNMVLSSPGADCLTTLAITHPYQVLKINSLKAVRTSESNVIESCG